MKNKDYAHEVTRKAIALEKAKNGNLHLPYDERDKIARQAKAEFTKATRELIDYEEREQKRVKLKTRDEMKEFLVDVFGGWSFANEEIIDAFADIFEEFQFKPTGQRPEFVRKPEESEVLTPRDIYRLERDLELRPLFESAYYAVKHNKSFNGMEGLKEAFKNLKPLQKEPNDPGFLGRIERTSFGELG